ncbi:MAG: toll/interleukin-1 receptor domain-containing protein [Acidobacteria bacterium]|nr:toll/interleukin-1 receptor domain-containing protein [Acidobacteriota bacterium]
MAYDVFISHALADKTIADMVCATLEQQGIRCWIAPRDVQPGAAWGEAIVSAIRGSRVLVLVFSDHANASKHIQREVERAIDHEIPILPFRIENVVPSGALEDSLSGVH